MAALLIKVINGGESTPISLKAGKNLIKIHTHRIRALQGSLARQEKKLEGRECLPIDDNKTST